MQQNEKNKRQLRLSVYQKSFFLEWALAPYESTYNYTSVHKLTGRLNKKALKQALKFLLKEMKLYMFNIRNRMSIAIMKTLP